MTVVVLTHSHVRIEDGEIVADECTDPECFAWPRREGWGGAVGPEASEPGSPCIDAPMLTSMGTQREVTRVAAVSHPSPSTAKERSLPGRPAPRSQR